MLVLHRAKLLASNQSVLALGVAPRQVAGTPVPVFTPGTDAGRVCPKALHNAEPIKHTQPFTGERGQGDRDNKSEVYFKNRLFLQTGAVGFCRPYFYTPKGIKQSLSAEITPYRV